MSYSSEVLADSPWGFWKTDETSGTNLADSSGNTRPLTITGSAHTLAQTGPDGASADAIAWASGVTGRASSADTVQLNATNFTIEAWVYLSALPSNNAPVVASASLAGTATPAVIWVNTSGVVNFRLFDTSSRVVTAPSPLSTGAWHHVVGVSDIAGTTMRLRIDKVASGSTTIASTTSAPGALPLMLRGSGTFLATPTGAIKTARPAVYQSALSNARIDAHYDAALGTVGGTTINGGQATETDTAQAGTTAVGGAYSSAVLADSPLGYWRLGDTSGTTMTDSSGNAHHGSYVNTPTLGAASLVTSLDPTAAVDFNGTDEYGEVPYGAWAAVSTGVTVEAWIRPDDITTHERVIFSRFNGYAQLSVTTGGRVRFKLDQGGGGSTDYLTGFSTIETGFGLTYHLVGTYDSDRAKVYVNGVLVLDTNTSGALSTSGTPPIYIGSTDGTVDFFDGRIDEVAYYDHALTAARVTAHYDAGRADVDITGGQAQETDTALAGTVSTQTAITGGQAQETDAALAGTIIDSLVTLVTGGTAEETDEALAGTIVFSYAATDTSNRVGGRRRGGYAVAVWDPPVVEAPPALVFGEARDKAQAFGPVTMHGTQPVYDVDVATKTRHRDRIVVGGKDITYFRDVPTPLPAYQLVSPLLYGPATLRLPQVAAAFEHIGVGALSWLRKDAPVKIQRVDPDTGTVVATDYKGVVIAFDTSGRDLTVEIGGEASGRAAKMHQTAPIFRAVHDIGVYAYNAIRDLGLPFAPRLGPTTGINLARFGDTGMLDYISQLCARAWTRSGNQWTIMPGPEGIYRMARKDTTTIDATAYLDDARTVGDLRRDTAEEHNRIYATGITPEGQRVRFGSYPGLRQGKAAPYPFNDNRNFGVGTTNGDTDTGDGIVVMVGRLQVCKYMPGTDAPGGYDADAAEAIRQLQDDAGLPVTGTMTPTTWRALYDLDATGFSLRWSKIQPAAQASFTRQWLLSGSGAIMGRNPNYDPKRLKSDRVIDLGAGLTIAQMREFARAEKDAAEDNWVGTITFHTGALVAGDHTPGDPIAASDLFRARHLKPGMNLSLPQFQGGIVVHVSAVSVDEDGKVTATVDTRARDSMNVWEVIARNRESRKDLARQWENQHRASGMTKDALDGWDEVGGRLGSKVSLTANTWETFEVVAGQEGQVRQLLTQTNPNAEYVLAIFGRAIGAKRLAKLVGNPFDITAHVSSFTVDDAGSGYTSSPDVDITGGGGSGATGHAVIGDGGKVLRVNVVSHGSGYTSAPSVSLTGGGGSGASVSANVSETGSDRWSDPGVRKELDDRLLLYVAGSDEEPLGYFPRRKQGDHPLTGTWKDQAGFPYYTYAQPVIYVAVYADRDTAIPAGRIMWPQLEAGA